MTVPRWTPTESHQTRDFGKFLIIGVEGANFFNSAKRGKEEKRGGRGRGERREGKKRERWKYC